MTIREKEKEDLACASTDEIAISDLRKPRKRRVSHTSTENLPAIKSRLAWGGVSSERGRSAAHNLETISTPPGRPSIIGTFPEFTYHGGPVIASPQVYASFWGALWSSNQEYKRNAQRLTQFHQDLLKSNFMNVLSQYGVGTGAGSGVYVQSSFVTNIPSTLNGPLIQGVIQSCINSKAIPEPADHSNNILMIYLDETINVRDLANDLELGRPEQDAAFGYHSCFRNEAGHPFYYAIIPALTDARLREVYANGNRNCSLLLSDRQEQRQTQVASHEFAEITTNPELNAWFDPVYGENGDICNGEPDIITVGANQWVVQRIYSKFDDIQTQGASYRWSQAPSPKSLLSPGPVVRPAALASTSPSACLLPLPPVHVNNSNEEATIDLRELRDYTLDIFHPLREAHIIADLPNLLRGVVTVLETDPEQLFLDTSPNEEEAQQEQQKTPVEQPMDLPRMLREAAAILETGKASSDTSEDEATDGQSSDDANASHDDDTTAQHDDSVEAHNDKGAEPDNQASPFVEQEQQSTASVAPLQHAPAISWSNGSASHIAGSSPFASGYGWRQSGKAYWLKWWPVATSGLLLVILLLGTMMVIAHSMSSTQGQDLSYVNQNSVGNGNSAKSSTSEVISKQQLDQEGWTKAGLTQSDAVAAQRTAATFVGREMSYDYHDIGTPTHHAGTFTAATSLLTPGARTRFQNNDVRMINNALYEKVRSEQIVRQATNVQAKLSQFRVVPIQGQQRQFAWFTVSFNRFQSYVDQASAKRIEGDEMDPTLEQLRTYQMMVVVLHVPTDKQALDTQLGSTGWLVNTYDLDTTTPLAIETTPTL